MLIDGEVICEDKMGIGEGFKCEWDASGASHQPAEQSLDQKDVMGQGEEVRD